MDSATEEAEGEILPVGLDHYLQVESAHEHALVVLAMGNACWVVESPHGGYVLAVEPDVLPRARREIFEYERERRDQSASETHRHAGGFRHPVGWAWHVGWVLLTGWMFLLRLRDPGWIERAGQSHDSVWNRGEWWRVFSALFVHGDFGHWAGNALSGTVFAALCSRYLGAASAWVVILLCGSFGNLISSWLSDEAKTVTIGASTAVFAALGIFCSLAVARERAGASSFSLRNRLRSLAPVIAGLVLLGWLGTGQGMHDGTTDVRAHLAGFGVGLSFGLLGRLWWPSSPNE